MGWFDLSSWIPSRYAQDAQQMAPGVATTPGATQALGTAPETPGYTATGARRRFRSSKKGGKRTRRSKKTSRR